MARLVRKTPGVLVGRGIGAGVSRIPPSDVGLSALGSGGSVNVDVDWDRLERSAVAGRFLLQGRGMAGIGSLACRRLPVWDSCGSSAEARGLLPALVGAGCTRLGWLSFLNKREKDIGLVKQVLREKG